MNAVQKQRIAICSSNVKASKTYFADHAHCNKQTQTVNTTSRDRTKLELNK